MKVVYLTVLENTDNNNIHKNQILSLRSAKVNYLFLFISPLFILNRSSFKRNKHKTEEKDCYEYKIPLFSYNFYLHIILLPYLFFWAFPVLIYFFVKNKPDMVHCRNLLSAFLALCVKSTFRLKYTIIADPRSVYPEEGVIIKRWKLGGFNYKVWKRFERWTFKQADVCIGLSTGLTDYLTDFNPNSYYIPAVVSESFRFNPSYREKQRQKFHLEETDFLFIYIGSIGLWHDVELLIQLLQTLRNLLQERFKVMALCSSSELQTGLIRHFGKQCLFCGSVPSSEVKHYLAMADFGIIPGSLHQGEAYQLLYDTMLASKAEEYLCSGLPVICSDRIVNLTRYINRYQWGTVYNTLRKELKPGIKLYSATERNRISQQAIQMFGLQGIQEQLFTLYQKLSC